MKDYLLQNSPEINLNFKQVFSWSNLPLLIVVILAILILNVVDQQGATFRGDPYFHLAILRKVVEGQPLTIHNLSYVRDQLHPAYLFPVWHIFLGIMAKITSTSIYTIWSLVVLPLLIFSFIVWYWIFKKLFGDRTWVAIAIIFFLSLTFGWNKGYLFTRITVPDTLNQILFFPLAVGLSLEYLFGQSQNIKYLIVGGLMALFMGLIHLTQFFYLFLVLGIFFILYLISKFRDSDFKLILKRFIWLLSIVVLATGVIYIFYQFTSKMVTTTSQSFSEVANVIKREIRYSKFSNIPIYGKLAYLFLPLILVFVVKNRRLLIVLALFLVTPFIYYISPLKNILLNRFGFIFVNRLYANVTWYFVIFALVVILTLIFLERWLFKLESRSKFLKHLFLLSSFLIIFGIFYILVKVPSFYNFLSSSTDSWLGRNGLWIFILVSALSAYILIIFKFKPELSNYFILSKPKNQLFAHLLILILTIFLSIKSFYYYNYYFTKAIKNKHFFRKEKDLQGSVVRPLNIGGTKTIDFIKEKIPPKSILVSNSGYYILPLMLDQHMAVYKGKASESFLKIFEDDTPTRDVLQMINDYEVEYILYFGKKESIEPLDNSKRYFTKIHEHQDIINKVEYTTLIYKVEVNEISNHFAMNVSIP